MQTIERTPTTTGPTVTAAYFNEHMRLDEDLQNGAAMYVDAASVEVEQYCALALLEQTITVTTDNLPEQHLTLPIGPVAADATVTVELVEQDGTTTPVPDGYWLEGGRFPVLHFIGTRGGRLRVTYPAGYGDTSTDIPPDLRIAICDLSARLYDYRASDKTASMPAATARICARYRRVSL